MRVITSFSYGLALFLQGKLEIRGNEFWMVGCSADLVNPPNEDAQKELDMTLDMHRRRLQRFGTPVPLLDREIQERLIQEYLAHARQAIAEERWSGKEATNQQLFLRNDYQEHLRGREVLGLQKATDDELWHKSSLSWWLHRTGHKDLTATSDPTPPQREIE